jgi:hypothetical protein
MKKIYLPLFSAIFSLCVDAANAKDIGVKVTNIDAQPIKGYQLVLEIRKVNDPVFTHKVDLNGIAPHGDKHYDVKADLEKYFQDENESISASNTIIHLVDHEGKNVASYNYPQSLPLNSFAGFQVKVDVEKKTVSIHPTSDTGGTLVLGG